MSLDGWLGIGLRDQVVDEAIEWVIRLDDSDLSDHDRLQFFIWLEQSPEHHWAYEEISEVWSKLHGLREVADALHRSEVIAFPLGPSTTENTALVGLKGDPFTRWSWSAIILVVVGMVAAAIA